MSDGHRPNRFPLAALEADWLICWVCQACGITVNESRPDDAGDCPIDWRNGETALDVMK